MVLDDIESSTSNSVQNTIVKAIETIASSYAKSNQARPESQPNRRNLDPRLCLQAKKTIALKLMEGYSLKGNGEICFRCQMPLMLDKRKRQAQNQEHQEELNISSPEISHNDNVGVCVVCKMVDDAEDFERKLVMFTLSHAAQNDDEEGTESHEIVEVEEEDGGEEEEGKVEDILDSCSEDIEPPLDPNEELNWVNDVNILPLEDEDRGSIEIILRQRCKHCAMDRSDSCHPLSNECPFCHVAQLGLDVTVASSSTTGNHGSLCRQDLVKTDNWGRTKSDGMLGMVKVDTDGSASGRDNEGKVDKAREQITCIVTSNETGGENISKKSQDSCSKEAAEPPVQVVYVGDTSTSYDDPLEVSKHDEAKHHSDGTIRGKDKDKASLDALDKNNVDDGRSHICLSIEPHVQEGNEQQDDIKPISVELNSTQVANDVRTEEQEEVQYENAAWNSGFQDEVKSNRDEGDNFDENCDNGGDVDAVNDADSDVDSANDDDTDDNDGCIIDDAKQGEDGGGEAPNGKEPVKTTEETVQPTNPTELPTQLRRDIISTNTSDDHSSNVFLCESKGEEPPGIKPVGSELDCNKELSAPADRVVDGSFSVATSEGIEPEKTTKNTKVVKQLIAKFWQKNNEEAKRVQTDQCNDVVGDRHGKHDVVEQRDLYTELLSSNVSKQHVQSLFDDPKKRTPENATQGIGLGPRADPPSAEDPPQNTPKICSTTGVDPPGAGCMDLLEETKQEEDCSSSGRGPHSNSRGIPQTFPGTEHDYISVAFSTDHEQDEPLPVLSFNIESDLSMNEDDVRRKLRQLKLQFSHMETMASDSTCSDSGSVSNFGQQSPLANTYSPGSNKRHRGHSSLPSCSGLGTITEDSTFTPAHTAPQTKGLYPHRKDRQRRRTSTMSPAAKARHRRYKEALVARSNSLPSSSVITIE
ncbi:hypothetical protein ACHAWF_017785 [Thalassiosira exigua]